MLMPAASGCQDRRGRAGLPEAPENPKTRLCLLYTDARFRIQQRQKGSGPFQMPMQSDDRLSEQRVAAGLRVRRS